jgi:diguanylate cyclase (GGDEF)-like protein
VLTVLLGDFSLNVARDRFALQVAALSWLLLVGMVYALYRQHVRLKAQQATLDRLVRTDSLTELGNRRSFWELAHQEARRAHRQGFVVALLIIDLDQFKRVNDSLGHLRGDALLQGVGVVIRASTRADQDAVFRIGGDEFAVLLPGSDLTAAATVADRIVSGIASGFDELPHGLTSCSVGMALLVEGETVEQWVDRADKAMYQAKASGGGHRRAVPPDHRAVASTPE